MKVATKVTKLSIFKENLISLIELFLPSISYKGEEILFLIFRVIMYHISYNA